MILTEKPGVVKAGKKHRKNMTPNIQQHSNTKKTQVGKIQNVKH
jgi:hypothetical protein